MTMTRRRLLDNTFKKTAAGNPAVAQGSLARRGPGIVMEGWTKQDRTTGAQLLDEKQLLMSDVYWQYKDGEFIGTNASSTYVYAEMELLPGEYAFSVYCVELDGIGKLEIRYGGETIARITFENVGRKEISFVAEEGKTYRLLFGDNGNGNMTYSRPMLNTGSTALPYEPYTGGVPSPSPDYPQEIVSAGMQNQETGKWEYEITITNAQTDPDKNQTVTLTADRPLTKWDKLEKRNGQWGWVYKSAEAVFDGSEEWSLYPNESVGTVFYTAFPNASFGVQTSLCDKYRNINNVWSDKYNGVFGIYSDNAVATAKYFRPPSAAVETVGQWKVWLSENPLTLWYETEVETFVPLTAAEQEAMNALHTYRPTTVLSNDCECNMSLTYKTKKSMVGGGNPYGLEIGGIAGGGGGYEFEATNRIRTDYIPFYSPDGSRTYTIVGNPYNIANSNAYDNQKNALGSYEMTAGAFTPPAGTWFIRISFSKPDNSDFTQEELNQLIRTFDIERS